MRANHWRASAILAPAWGRPSSSVRTAWPLIRAAASMSARSPGHCGRASFRASPARSRSAHCGSLRRCAELQPAATPNCRAMGELKAAIERLERAVARLEAARGFGERRREADSTRLKEIAERVDQALARIGRVLGEGE